MTETVVKSKTVVKSNTEPELDEELLAEVMQQLGGVSRNEALNTALLELVVERRARRRRALENLQRMSDEGVFDYDALDELDR